MKTQTDHTIVSYRNALWFAGIFLLGLIAASAVMWSPTTAARANDSAPLIALLTPQDGTSFNSASLRVQALIAAVKPKPGETFVFNGKTVTGRNAGRVRRVGLALDGATGGS
ncbi:MAG TPA: hypothetical protein VIU65_10300 [Pyrinomonadaceae bacterium]